MLTWEAAYARSFQIQVSGQRHDLDHHLHHDDRHRRHADPHRQRHRPLRADERHRPGHAVRLLAVGVRRAHHGSGQPPSAAAPAVPDRPDGFWGDTSTIPAAQNVVMVKILNRTNGRYPDSQVYWSFNGQTRSIAEQPYIDMPANSAGRMYFYLGSPNSQYFDFIEFTVGPNVFNGNTTRVDAFGLKLAMRLHADDGYDVAGRRGPGDVRRGPGGDVPAVRQRGAGRVRAPGPDPGAVPDPVAGQLDPSSGPAGSTRTTSPRTPRRSASRRPRRTIFGCAGVAGQQPEHVRRAQPARRRTCRVRSSPTRRNFYQTAPANYYSRFWHDHAHQQAVVRVPVRRLRRTVVVHLPRQPE